MYVKLYNEDEEFRRPDILKAAEKGKRNKQAFTAMKCSFVLSP